MAESQQFLQYHEPNIVQILTIISFFFFLSLAEWVSAKVIRAGIIGQIAVGIIYGRPLADIIPETWQETFLALGYIGLILIIFEGYHPFLFFFQDDLADDEVAGGLTARLDLLKRNFILSLLAATTGVVFPIGLSYLLLYLGFGYGINSFMHFVLLPSISAKLEQVRSRLSSSERHYPPHPSEQLLLLCRPRPRKSTSLKLALAVYSSALPS